MSESRKPVFTMLLRFQGKKFDVKKNLKVELFSAEDYWQKGRDSKEFLKSRYRIRVNGKWCFGIDSKKKFFTWYQFRDIFWRSLTESKDK